MVDIITSYDAAIFAIIMDKPDEPIIVPEHHLPKQYYLLFKKVEFYCNHHHYGNPMMIFDDVHEDADRKIAEAITGFLFKTKFGHSFHHILEISCCSVIFANSSSFSKLSELEILLSDAV